MESENERSQTFSWQVASNAKVELAPKVLKLTNATALLAVNIVYLLWFFAVFLFETLTLSKEFMQEENRSFVAVSATFWIIMNLITILVLIRRTRASGKDNSFFRN